MELIELPSETRDMIEAELHPGEQILWLGQPKATYLNPASLGMVVFAIPWTAFAIFWVCGAAGFTWPTWKGPQSLFPLFGVPFILIGLGMFLAPFWMMRAARKSAYVLTGKRAIVVQWRVRSAEIISFESEQLTHLRKIVRRHGEGDLVFEERSQGSGRYRSVGFIGISDVREVENLIARHILHEAP